MQYLFNTGRIAGWLLLLAITVLSLVPPDLRPETGVPHNLEHLTIFAATGFAFGFGNPGRVRWAAGGLILFSGLIELAQALVPGRHARLSDFLVDALAMVVALAAGAIIASGLSKRFGKNP